jgi:UDP-glucuronate decarboxylase
MIQYKKILVTGGAGFIGTNLIMHLINNTKSEIICLDNFFSGKLSNIEKLLGPRVKLIEADIRNPFDIESDLIINLACPASPVKYQYDKVFTAETSVMGIMNVCNNAKKYGSKIVQASTSEVYGDPKIHPQSEKYFGNVNIVGIRSCYDEGKRFAETYLNDFSIQNNIKYNIIRIFNTYGPYMAHDDGRVVSNFIIQSLKGDDITIYGDGKQTRSICYVDDLIDGICKLAFSKINQSITNLGNNHELKIIDIANMILKLTNSKSKLTFEDLPQNDPLQRKPDLTKIKSLIDWNNLTPPEKGLDKTISYFKSINVL